MAPFTSPISVLLSLGLAWLLATTATAAPVGPLDLSTCHTPSLPNGTLLSTSCCLLNSSQIINYTLPTRPLTLRIRRAAHHLDAAYLQKYRNAIAAMKNLSSDHPWNFLQQANIHCAYCNEAYNQTGYTNIPYQVHFSWLFFPFHRAYLYFYERILGKLIDDDTFAIPFWNWDNPPGMTMPNIFTNDTTSPLYDQYRDQNHQPPTIIDLNYNGTDDTTSTNRTYNNLVIMNRQMITAAPTPELFLGQPYRAGDQPTQGPGTLEQQPHNIVHQWSGDRTQANGEDMGAFYSAGRDPLFYAHHANVDRMWELWTAQLNHTNYADSDWLNARFIFWDENQQLVSISVRDCLDNKAMGYDYETVAIPWLTTPPEPAKPVIPQPTKGLTFPVSLESGQSAFSVAVQRPTGLLTGLEEVLVVENVTVSSAVYTKFDVYINAGANDSTVSPASSEFAGSFVSVPMGGGEPMVVRRFELGISQLQTDISAGTSVIVTLASRTLGTSITVADQPRIATISIPSSS